MLAFQFTDANGDVAQEFGQKLQALIAENSKGELSIERYLQNSEEAFFDNVRKEKISSASSIRSSNRDSVWGATSVYEGNRPHSPGQFSTNNSSAHLHFGSHGEEYYGPLMNDLGECPVMRGLQIAMQREIGGWPLYTLILVLSQMLGATSFPIAL